MGDYKYYFVDTRTLVVKHVPASQMDTSRSTVERGLRAVS